MLQQLLREAGLDSSTASEMAQSVMAGQRGVVVAGRSRGTAPGTAQFEDAVALFFGADHPLFASVATTVPNKVYVEKPLRADGAACYVPGVYRDHLVKGYFRGRLCLRQVKGAEIVRVKLSAGQLLYTSPIKGLFGQHVHDCGVEQARTASNASAGCIVTSVSMQRVLASIPETIPWDLVLTQYT